VTQTGAFVIRSCGLPITGCISRRVWGHRGSDADRVPALTEDFPSSAGPCADRPAVVLRGPVCPLRRGM